MFNNTVGELTSLPVLLQKFYHEEVRNEKTGNQIEESYTYTDENDVEQTGTRLVDEYQDVTYVVINQRAQSTSEDKVHQVIDKHCGNRDDVIDIFVNFYIETLKWNYHDSYIEWLEKRPDTTDEKYDLMDVDENGEEVPIYDFDSDLSSWESIEPEEPAYPTLEEWKLSNYAMLRKAAYLPIEQQLEMQFDGTWNDHILEVKAKYPKA